MLKYSRLSDYKIKRSLIMNKKNLLTAAGLGLAAL